MEKSDHAEDRSSLPTPLTPPDCDLRGYEFMPLYGVRLFGSTLYSKALHNPRAGLAAIRLWWAAWQQCPAGSLPDDEYALCHLADFGTDLKAWRGVAWRRLQCAASSSATTVGSITRCCATKPRPRTSGGSATVSARPTIGKNLARAVEAPRKFRGTSRGQAAGRTTDTRKTSMLTGQDRTERTELRSDAGASGVSARDALWREGIPRLRHLTGLPEGRARSLLGRLLRAAGDDCPKVLAAIQSAVDMQLADPTAWLMRAVEKSASVRNGFLASIEADKSLSIDPVGAFLEAENERIP